LLADGSAPDNWRAGNTKVAQVASRELGIYTLSCARVIVERRLTPAGMQALRATTRTIVI
jgi:hypothetical protein